MKKISIILVMLLWCNTSFAENIVFSSKDFIIVEYKNYVTAHRVVYGAESPNMYLEGISIPKIANNYCTSLGKNTYLLGKKGKHFDGRSVYVYVDYWNGWSGKSWIRYFCAKSKDEAHKNFTKVIHIKKYGKVKVSSKLVYYGHDEFDLYNDKNLIWVSNEKEKEKKRLAKLQEEKNKLKEEKKKEKKERIAKGKASCGDYIDMNWYSNSYGASFEFDNPSTETIRITRVAVKTKNKEIMLQEQHDLILEPFTKKNRIWIAKDNFMHELAKWGSYGCSFAPKGTKVKKSKNNQGTQSKKNGGKSLIEKIFGD